LRLSGAALALAVPVKNSSPVAATISNKTFVLDPNEKHAKSLSFNFTND